MTSRILGAVGAAVVVGTLVGCGTGPAPEPTPTAAFASEAEAFAAAEQVYRAYNEAANARVRGEPDPDPHDYLSGAALEGDIDAENLLRELHLTARGAATVASFTGAEARIDGSIAEVSGYVCIDVSGLRVLNEEGVDVTPSNRGDVVAQVVVFSGDPSSLMIISESSAEEDSC